MFGKVSLEDAVKNKEVGRLTTIVEVEANEFTKTKTTFFMKFSKKHKFDKFETTMLTRELMRSVSGVQKGRNSV